MSRLDISSNTTETISSGTTETYEGADVDGSLDVQGSLRLVDIDDDPDNIVGADNPIDLPLGSINLPVGSISIGQMQTGASILFVGLLTILGGASALLKNYAAGVAVAMAVIALLLAGTVNLGVEVFYAFLIGAALLLAAGAAIQWSGVS